ncbi:dihydrodipicolinate synthase family protein [Actinotalea solisilvae]|uniref:dihydrodipicolinate synthase family protein n=1 Tax=Actinotalea solisilvae TaxID=2072922 RepID=UPI0027DAC870|nr:dihydrodipicolinate synthase family protein [Actinotalea solisilvae]
MSPSSRTFHGVVPPVVTPLDADGGVDHAGLEALVEHLVGAGVHGLFALGSTGETAYLTNAERVDVARTIVSAAAGRVPVIAGAIELTAARVLDAARPLVAAGVDAVVVTPAIYALHDRQETTDHFRRIAAGLDVPLWAYDVPVRTHTKLPADLLVGLGEAGVLAGVKDSSGDDVGFRRLLAANAAAGSPLRLLTGHEVVVDAMLLAGADGVVPGLANVDAAGYVRLWDAARRGDWASARSEQERLNALFEIVFQATGRSGDAAGVGAFKVAMEAQGLLASATMAHPVQALDGAVAERVRAVVHAAGLGR